MFRNQTRARVPACVRAAVKPVLETLEARQLLSTTLNQGVLTIVGTPGDDAITINCLGGPLKMLEVLDNGTRRVYSRAVVNSIKILGKQGNDRIEINDSLYSLKKPAYIDGGTGNDTLIGASGADRIYGKDGNDLIIGQASPDVLYGGAGNDRILGGRGPDLLYGDEGDDLINTGETGVTAGADGGAGANEINSGRAAMWQPRILFGPDRSPKAFNGTVVGLTPDQIRAAYDLDDLQNGKFAVLFNNLAQNSFGEGQVITIINAYYSPTVQQDLDKFSETFALPKTTVEVVYAQGEQPAVDELWAMEIALDVQWAHAVAPAAKIRLVLAETNLTGDLLTGYWLDDVWVPPAVDVAVDLGKEGTVISMSFGADEIADDLAIESHFTHVNTGKVTFVAASGDDAGIISHPGVSPNVLSVGGTELYVDANGVRTAAEDAWEDAGGGVSSVFGRPIYQDGVTVGGTPLGDYRGVPDVAYNGDPVSGVAVYNTTPIGGDTGWMQVGGTSAGSPQWAALITIANQLRTYLGREVLGEDAVFALYSIARINQTGHFYDITLNANANPALEGYDLATGWGSPRADKLVPALAGFLDSDIIFRANYYRPMSPPVGPDRVIINMGGAVGFTWTKTEVNVIFAMTADNGGRGSIVLDAPLVRDGKKIIKGFGTANIQLDNGEGWQFKLQFSGKIFRDAEGRVLISGHFWTIDDAGNVLDNSFQPILTGYWAAA